MILSLLGLLSGGRLRLGNWLLLGGRLLLDNILWFPSVVVEVVVWSRRLRRKASEEFSKLINAHFSNTLVFSWTNVNTAIFDFFLTGNEDVVPLFELSVSDLLVELSVRTIEFNFEALFVKIEHDTFAVVNVFLGNGDNNSLSWGNKEGPFST